MYPILPFDIFSLIIDIAGENEDTSLLKELVLVSHSFHQICIKYLFANVELHDVDLDYFTSSKKGFIKLVKGRPNVVNYIRKITYKVSHNNNSDLLLSPMLSNFFPTTSRLNCLAINASNFRWNELDSSLTSAFLHLMSLPTMNHIDLSNIQNFPLSSLTSSVNLLRLDILRLTCRKHFDHEEDNFIKTVQSEMMPKIREFHTSGSCLLTKKLLPVFNFMDLRHLSVSLSHFKHEPNIRYLLQNAKLLERLHLSVGNGVSFMGLLSTSARTLKVLDLTVYLYQSYHNPPLAGLCEELEAIAGHNMLEALSFEVLVYDFRVYSQDSVRSAIQKVEDVLVKPGWSTLRQVSFKIPVIDLGGSTFTEALQSLPNEYLGRLSQLESIVFNFSASVVKYKA